MGNSATELIGKHVQRKIKMFQALFLLTHKSNKSHQGVGAWLKVSVCVCAPIIIPIATPSKKTPTTILINSYRDSHVKQDIEAIENVQKFALRVCLKSWDCSYDQLLVQASLLSMQERRNLSRLYHLYKIIQGLTHFPDAPLEQRTTCSSHNTRSTISVTFKLPQFRTNRYTQVLLFFPRALPPEISQCLNNDDDDNHTFINCI